MTQSSHHHHHHALCCLSAAPPQPDAPPTPAPEPAAATATAVPGSGSVAVAGVLHKWTNYGRGWRERWFSLRDGVLSYSKIRSDAGAGAAAEGGIAEDGEVRLIGGASARIAGDRRPEKPAGIVCLKVGVFSSLVVAFWCPRAPASWWGGGQIPFPSLPRFLPPHL
jgi:hypothetical protein